MALSKLLFRGPDLPDASTASTVPMAAAPAAAAAEGEEAAAQLCEMGRLVWREGGNRSGEPNNTKLGTDIRSFQETIMFLTCLQIIIQKSILKRGCDFVDRRPIFLVAFLFGLLRRQFWEMRWDLSVQCPSAQPRDSVCAPVHWSTPQQDVSRLFTWDDLGVKLLWSICSQLSQESQLAQAQAESLNA